MCSRISEIYGVATISRLPQNIGLFCNNLTSTGWRRLIGSRKLQIIFHKRAIKYRLLLRRMIYKDKGSYESSPPCINEYEQNCDDVTCNIKVEIKIDVYSDAKQAVE